MLDLLDMFSQPELAHAGLERMMDEEAARHLAAGQVPPLEQRRANMAAEVISASRARNETARDTFKSSLEQCKKLGSSLTPEDRESINLLNRFSEISREASS